MCLNHFLRKDVSAADILRDLTCQVVPHRAVDDRILVRILLLGQLVVMAQEREDLGIRTVLLPEHFVPQPVFTIVQRKPVMPRLLQFIDHHVLDFFDAHTPAKISTALFDPSDNKTDLRIGKPVSLRHLTVGCFDGVLYLPVVIWDFSSVPFDDFQLSSSSICFRASASSSTQPFPRYLRHCSSRHAYITSCSSVVRSMV